MTEIEMKIKELSEKFRLPGELVSVSVISNGNINTTYDVKLCLSLYSQRMWFFAPCR